MAAVVPARRPFGRLRWGRSTGARRSRPDAWCTAMGRPSPGS